jgi:hypothetical protein
MGPRNRTPWNLIHDQQSSLLNKQAWHHVLEKSKPQINNINALHGPFRRLLFNSGQGLALTPKSYATSVPYATLASLEFTPMN